MSQALVTSIIKSLYSLKASYISISLLGVVNNV